MKKYIKELLQEDRCSFQHKYIKNFIRGRIPLNHNPWFGSKKIYLFDICDIYLKRKFKLNGKKFPGFSLKFLI